MSSTPATRLLHRGLGNSFRVHQDAGDSAAWSYVAFAGRRPDFADALAAQDCRYTLLTNGAEADRFQVIDRTPEAHPATVHDGWMAERTSPDGAELADDTTPSITTSPARLVAELVARRSAGASPVAIVPCDNLSDNGSVVAGVVRSVAEQVDARLMDWLEAHTSYVTTVVDRITQAVPDDDRSAVARATGWDDQPPAMAEPSSEWIIQGDFLDGRPAWETIGTMLNPYIDPFERRKLTLLNGVHSVLAYAGSSRGHANMSDAVSDPVCRRWIEQWWGEAERHLPLPADEPTAYHTTLLARFENRRVRHLLSQIAADGSAKTAVRTVPVLLAQRDEERLPEGATRALAAWLWHLRERTEHVSDVHAAKVLAIAAGPLDEAARGVLESLDAALADDAAVVAGVADHARSRGTR